MEQRSARAGLPPQVSQNPKVEKSPKYKKDHSAGWKVSENTGVVSKEVSQIEGEG